MSRSLRHHRRSLALLAGLLALALAGCGSSGSSSGNSTITLGAEPSGTPAVAAAAGSGATATTAAATTAAVTTPKTGPLSKEPKVVPPSGPAPTHLVIKDLIKGTGPAAPAGSSVTVNYVGVLYHGGKIFDASWTDGTSPNTLSLSEVIPGWTQGIPGMRVGGRRELIIPASLAYGAAGHPPTIPANAPLVFVIDLLGVQGS